MAHIQVKSERLINARPENVYALLSDYKSKRPQLLTPNFLNYTLEKGGQGQGTIIRYRLHAANRERDYRLNIDEPVKGKIITERDSNSSLVNTWTISPLSDGTRTRVSIINEWEGGSGVKGFFERTFAPLGLKSIYGQILGMVSLLASGETPATTDDVFAGKDESHRESQLAVFLLVSAGIVGFAFLLNYLQKKRS
jgi:hypothetical protein